MKTSTQLDGKSHKCSKEKQTEGKYKREKRDTKREALTYMLRHVQKKNRETLERVISEEAIPEI